MDVLGSLWSMLWPVALVAVAYRLALVLLVKFWRDITGSL